MIVEDGDVSPYEITDQECRYCSRKLKRPRWKEPYCCTWCQALVDAQFPTSYVQGLAKRLTVGQRKAFDNQRKITDGGGWLALCGSTGYGKTFSTIRLVWCRIKTNPNQIIKDRIRFISIPDFTRRYYDVRDRNSEWDQEFAHAKLIVLDDVGREDSRYKNEHLFEQMVHYCDEHEKQVIITTNLTQAEFEKYGAPVISRIRGGCGHGGIIVTVTGDDMRVKTKEDGK